MSSGFLQNKLKEDLILYGSDIKVYALIEKDSNEVRDYYIDTKYMPNIIEQSINNCESKIVTLQEIQKRILQ